MYNPHMIIMILSVIILVLSILIFSKKDKSSEYFQNREQDGQNCNYNGSEGGFACGSKSCNFFPNCRNWCISNCSGRGG